MLFKACGGEEFASKWYKYFYHVLWADRVSIRKGFGASPFFLVTGAHPVLPMDIIEATWLVELPDRVLTTEELIGFRARALAKHKEHIDEMRERVSKQKRDALLKFEEKHVHKIKDYKFKSGDLVLVRNSPVDNVLEQKNETSLGRSIYCYYKESWRCVYTSRHEREKCIKIKLRRSE